MSSTVLLCILYSITMFVIIHAFALLLRRLLLNGPVTRSVSNSGGFAETMVHAVSL